MVPAALTQSPSWVRTQKDVDIGFQLVLSTVFGRKQAEVRRSSVFSFRMPRYSWKKCGQTCIMDLLSTNIPSNALCSSSCVSTKIHCLASSRNAAREHASRDSLVLKFVMLMSCQTKSFHGSGFAGLQMQDSSLRDVQASRIDSNFFLWTEILVISDVTTSVCSACALCSVFFHLLFPFPPLVWAL